MLLFFFWGGFVSEAADTEKGNPPGDDSVPVISKNGEQVLSGIFSEAAKKKKKLTVTRLNIERTRIRICVREASAPSNLNPACWLLYPGKLAFPTDERVGNVAVHALRPGCDTFRERLLPFWKAIPADVWTFSAPESATMLAGGRKWADVAWTLLNEDRPGDVRKLLDEMAEGEETSLVWRLLEAARLGQEGDRKKALARLSELESDGLGGPEIGALRGRLDLLEGHVKEGLSLMAASLENFPESSVMRCRPFEDGIRLLMLRGKRTELLDIWNEGRTIFAGCHDAFIEMAERFLEWGMNAESEEILDYLVKENESNIDVLREKVKVLRRKKKDREALALLRDINRRFPNREDMIQLHSTIASSLKDAEAYRREMLAAAEADPEDLFAAHAAGVMSYYLGDYDRCRRLLEPLKKRLPGNTRVHIYTAMSHYHQGRWEEALQGLRYLESIQAKDPDLYYCLAILFSSKDIPRALGYLEQYLAVPHQPDEAPEKKNRAWREWEQLKQGIMPAEWKPGMEHIRDLEQAEDIDDGCRSLSDPASGLLAWILLSLWVGFRRKTVC